MKTIVTALIIIFANLISICAREWNVYHPKRIFQPDSSYFLCKVTTILSNSKNMYFSSWAGGIDVLDKNAKWSRLDYRNTPLDIYNDFITDIKVDEDNIYAGSRYGLLFINNSDTLLINDTNSDLPNQYVTNLALNNNDLWISTQKYYVLSKMNVKTKEITNFDIPLHVPIPNYNSGHRMIVDNNGLLWYIGVRGIVCFDGHNFKYWDSTNSILWHKEEINSFDYDTKSNKFIFFSSKFTDNIGKSRVLTIKNNELVEDEINKLNFEWDKNLILFATFDRDGYLYLGYRNQNFGGSPRDKFIMISGDKWQYIDLPLDMLNTDFLPYETFFVDNNDNLWIGTSQNGVLMSNIKDLKTSVENEVLNLPDIWIRNISPNPIKSKARVNFFCEPSLYSSISIKIFNSQGDFIKDISNDVNYDPNSATGIVDFQIENISQGIYYLNICSYKESRTIPFAVIE